jgi:hypothetical protein
MDETYDYDYCYKGKYSSKTLKSKSTLSSFFNPYIKPPEKYYKNQLRIGYTETQRLGKTYREDFWLDVSESIIAVLLGKRGSGKTWLLRRLMDMAFYTGFAPVIPCDVKNEFIASMNPANEKQQALFGLNEIARATPVKVFFPRFLGSPPQNNQSFQIGLYDLTYSDLLTLYGLSESGSSIAQTTTLLHIYNLIKDESIGTMDEFIEELEQMEDATPATKRALKMITQNIIRNEIIGTDFTININAIFEKDQIPVLDLVGYEELGLNTAAAYVAIFLRKIMNARRNKLIKKPLFVLIDEAHEFCNKKKDISSKEEIQKMVNLSRSWGISLILATQNMEDIPPKIMRQARYIFLPQGITWDEGKEIMKSQALLEWDRDAYNELIYLFKSLKRKKNGEREWICIDVNTKEYTTFFPYAPLSLHQSESRW